MDERPYFYRLRGRTLGPVGLRQIRQLAQRAQIGRNTEVSRDALQWGRAGDFPEVFAVTEDAIAHGERKEPQDGRRNEPDSRPRGEAPTWYYAIDGVQKGPVDLTTLQHLVATGQLKGADHVFPEGGTDWLQVSRVPQLAGAGLQPVTPVINVNVPPQTVNPPEGTNGLAIAGFVLSLVGCAPIGLILCLIALNSKNRANRGLAIAGAIIGGLLTLCGCGYVVIVFLAAAANAA